MALRDRRIKYFFKSWCLVGSGDFTNGISAIILQKSSIDRPQQPTTENLSLFDYGMYTTGCLIVYRSEVNGSEG
jgi:hypothetical protein